jgi:deoxyribose-phosphate aldolase
MAMALWFTCLKTAIGSFHIEKRINLPTAFHKHPTIWSDRLSMRKPMTIHPILRAAFDQNRALKVISGLTNFNADRVAAIVKAADQGGATFVDIAADPGLVRMARQLTHLPICVSAVEAQQFVPAVEAGADLIEIGNFDAFYAQVIRFEADEVLALTRDTRALLPTVTLSVTVPHILPLDQQAQLAEALVDAGADVIQTEGGTSSQPAHAGSLGLIEKAAPTLAAAHEIARVVDVPVLCASGLSSVTAPLAIAAGASGIGVGSAINQLNSEVAMVAAVRSLVDALNSVSRHPVRA